jgi:phospholipid/cholesterol/gamma-HCH transport system permease protein
MTGLSATHADPTVAGGTDQQPRPGGLARRLVTALGHWATARVEGLGRTGRFMLETVRAAGEVRTWGPVFSVHAVTLGVQSLPIAIYIAVFTGIVLALLASYSFTGAVPLYFVGTLVEKTVTMELAPVLTGLALAGRVGANIAAELGTMKVTEQIDALETLAYDPHAYLVVPRVLAGTLMFPIIVGVAVVIGVGAGWAASVALLQISSEEFTKGLRLFFDTFDVQYGLVKAASFGTAVTWIGCMQGLAARGGAQGVGRAATSAVVYSAVMILVLDAFWAVIWLLGHKP